MELAENLHNIEQIKQLKARYCRLLDAKDWLAWRALFADDFVSDTSGSGGKWIEGADAFVAYVQSTLGKPSRVTVHQIHAPEITLLSATEAEGIWALEDIVRFFPLLNLRGYGHYHEQYVQVNGEWKIKHSRLSRLKMELFNGLFAIPLPVRR
ncbi:nuclear transport factor 2 family protein [Spongiibacter sp. KMU-158]|uniref:Nuclear transport factor 2 family protein n=1 Tax=Spongiibacter pelagi TaxID=2760804 RepID=A0A927C5Q4_9GAMM|nr:nuclear transport factor 2 family protein [Spongiibacter pelagi]MBD2860241.1 nuclear transport factor 2 family protein [Spongiibacter pelagi]